LNTDLQNLIPIWLSLEISDEYWKHVSCSMS